MDIVIAAEKPSIARLLGEHMCRRIRPEDIRVRENPDETGSFFVGFDRDRFILMPDGQIAVESRERQGEPASGKDLPADCRITQGVAGEPEYLR